LPGPKYEKYNLNSGLDTPADTELELFVDDESGLIFILKNFSLLSTKK